MPGSRRLWLLIATSVFLFLSGMATGFDLSVRLYYALGLIVIISYVWSKWGFERMTARVDRPAGELSVGDTLRETITLENRGGPPKSWVEVEDHTSVPNLKIAEVVSLPGVVTFRRFTMGARLTQRGEFSVGPLVIKTADPFGIFPQEAVFAEKQSLVVYPRVEQIPDYAVPAAGLTGESSRRRRTYVLSPEVASVRDYSPGDSVSRIHWPTTARAGKLMVKTFEQGRASDIWVVFDQDASTVVGEGEESTDEYGASIAASTVDKYLGLQLPVGYAAHGSESLVLPPDHGSGQRSAIFRHIAVSRPTGDRPLFSLIAEIGHEVSRGSSVVAITSAPDGEWVDALGAVQKRGVQAVAVWLDRASFGDEGGAGTIRARLVALGVRTFVVGRGASIPGALSAPEGVLLATETYRIGREAAD